MQNGLSLLFPCRSKLRPAAAAMTSKPTFFNISERQLFSTWAYTRTPCGPHIRVNHTNPTVHMGRGCIRVGCGPTRPGGAKGRPRRREFGHKYGPGGHTRRQRATRRVRLGMRGHASLGVPRVHPHRRAERSAGPMCTPVERTKSALWSPLCPTPGPAAAPPVRASTPQHARM